MSEAVAMPAPRFSNTELRQEIEQDGKYIAAQIKNARSYEAAAEEKAGADLRKAADRWISIGQRLAAVKSKCKKAGNSGLSTAPTWAAPSSTRS